MSEARFLRVEYKPAANTRCYAYAEFEVTEHGMTMLDHVDLTPGRRVDFWPVQEWARQGRLSEIPPPPFGWHFEFCEGPDWWEEEQWLLHVEVGGHA